MYCDTAEILSQNFPPFLRLSEDKEAEKLSCQSPPINFRQITRNGEDKELIKAHKNLPPDLRLINVYCLLVVMVVKVPYSPPFPPQLLPCPGKSVS
jgi:hypothetical protein